jgi:hypothetical protein
MVLRMLVVAAGGYVYMQEQRNGVPLDVVNIRNPVTAGQRCLAVGEQVYTRVLRDVPR